MGRLYSSTDFRINMNGSIQLSPLAVQTSPKQSLEQLRAVRTKAHWGCDLDRVTPVTCTFCCSLCGVLGPTVLKNCPTLNQLQTQIINPSDHAFNTNQIFWGKQWRLTDQHTHKSLSESFIWLMSYETCQNTTWISFFPSVIHFKYCHVLIFIHILVQWLHFQVVT